MVGTVWCYAVFDKISDFTMKSDSHGEPNSYLAFGWCSFKNISYHAVNADGGVGSICRNMHVPFQMVFSESL